MTLELSIDADSYEEILVTILQKIKLKQFEYGPSYDCKKDFGLMKYLMAVVKCQEHIHYKLKKDGVFGVCLYKKINDKWNKVY